MKPFTIDTLKLLIDNQTDLNLSMYVRTYRANKDEQNRLGLKNSIKKAEHLLANWGKDDEFVKTFMNPIRDLQHDEEFLRDQSDGLVIFKNENLFEVYKLPIEFNPMAFVNTDFYLKPVIPMLEDTSSAHVMTVSPNKIRLLNITTYSVEELDISEDFPQTMEESHWHTDREPSIQNHGKLGRMFHGQGGSKDSTEEDMKRFFRDVNTGLAPFFRNRKNLLILAGVDSTVKIFKDTFHYHNIAENHISGNHDDTPMLDIHEHARNIKDQLFMNALQEEVNEMKHIKHTDKAEMGIAEIVKESYKGNIDTLYLKEGSVAWGYFDKDTFSARYTDQKTNGEIDLLNKAAIHTIINGGKVKSISSQTEFLEANQTAFAYLRN